MIKKYEEYINEKFKVIDYKIILKDIKDNPVTLITDFKVIKVENSKSEIKAKGYIKDKGGWIYFDDFKDNKTRLVWNKYFENGNKRINVLNENNSNKIIYPYDEMKSFINWFNKNYYKIAEEQGWGIFSSDTETPEKEYISNDSSLYGRCFWQIQHYDDLLLNSDTEADELARSMGLMIDEYGLIIGFDGVSFIEHPEFLNPKYFDKYKEKIDLNLISNKYNL